jgi:hypothetical protein
MSALGQKQTSRPEISMSALPPKADTQGHKPHVRFVPEADSCTAAKTVPKRDAALATIPIALTDPLSLQIEAKKLSGALALRSRVPPRNA